MAFKSIDDLNFRSPNHFPNPVYTFESNPVSLSKIELGRALFYDPILSLNNSISCASCHSPFNAFSHTDHSLSHGIYDSVGTRNSPALFNLAWQKNFMWDGAINHLDVQSLSPIHHPKEMASSINKVVEKLKKDRFYKKQFYKSFSDSTITGQHVLQSLSQFQLSLVSADSKYDKVKNKKEYFSKKEERGYQLFKANCNNCHLEPLFSTYDFASNGIPIDKSLQDYGRIKVTNLKKDSNLFKIPSLRNLSFSYPYMHDGRFSSLRQVLNHYSDGIKNNEQSLNHAKSMSFSSNEKTDLISFLMTLNDTSFVFNTKHQFPKVLLSK
ncbi:MAG: Cytochrome c551 peroxidase [Owenweeksia sp. TMED14]|nr:MAG: Cytochrome c551 peroxidase [Owenweeksia sp. TMED14]|tara:strand:- start:561 stop:1535 length:975 start_codon:yes stop_codon:yes gene_type:complete